MCAKCVCSECVFTIHHRFTHDYIMKGMLDGEESFCLNTANPLDKCWNKCKRVVNALWA